MHAITDVTGFGILGHGLELARGAGLTLALDADALPLLPQAEALVAGRLRHRRLAPQLGGLWRRRRSARRLSRLAPPPPHRSADLRRPARHLRGGPGGRDPAAHPRVRLPVGRPDRANGSGSGAHPRARLIGRDRSKHVSGAVAGSLPPGASVRPALARVKGTTVSRATLPRGPRRATLHRVIARCPGAGRRQRTRRRWVPSPCTPGRRQKLEAEVSAREGGATERQSSTFASRLDASTMPHTPPISP